jgi:DNA-binding GntR family transcriptional regulator
MREALEGMACRLAATTMSDQEIAVLSALLEEHGRSKGVRTGSDYYQGSANEDFHFRIVRSSDNTRLIKALCEDLYYQIRIYRYRSSVSPGRARAAFDKHKAIVKALRARDPDRAEAAMRKHISHAQANLVLVDIQSIKKEMVHA